MRTTRFQRTIKVINALPYVFLFAAFVPLLLEVIFLGYYGHSGIPGWLFIISAIVAALSATMTNFRLAEVENEENSKEVSSQ